MADRASSERWQNIRCSILFHLRGLARSHRPIRGLPDFCLPYEIRYEPKLAVSIDCRIAEAYQQRVRQEQLTGRGVNRGPRRILTARKPLIRFV